VTRAILTTLGISPDELQAARIELTRVLPGSACAEMEAAKGAAAGCRPVASLVRARRLPGADG